MLTAKGYPVKMEIAGNRAMWRDPSTGDAPRSFPVPTMSAAKGIIESIAFLKRGAVVLPYRIELCSPLIWSPYNFNCTGVGRKTGTINSQTYSEALINVCYRIYALTVPTAGQLGIAHFYQDLIERRLKKGQCFAIPFLGWSEFNATYYGPFRDGTKVFEKNIDIGSMPLLVFRNGLVDPIFTSSAKIKKGVLDYAQRIEEDKRLVKVTWAI